MTQHSNDSLPLLLDRCADLIQAGESVAACLARYPEHASALAPLLETVTTVRGLGMAPQRDPRVAAESRAAFLAAANLTAAAVRVRRRPRRSALGLWWEGVQAGWRDFLTGLAGARPAFVTVTAILVFILVAGVLTTGAVTASANSLPGDPLYPVKTAAEQVQLLLTFDPDAKDELAERFSERRVEETRAVLDLGRTVEVPLLGAVEAIAADEWQIAGLPVIVTSQTVIMGRPTIGAFVQGRLRAEGDGTLVALRIEVMPGLRRAIAPTVAPTPTQPPTALPPTATPSPVPAPIVVEPASRPQEPSPEPTQTPTATAAPTATATATVTQTPTPTITRTPTVTRTPTITLTPSATLAPAPKRHSGWVVRIEGSRWTIRGDIEITVDTDGDTQYFGDPVVGSLVDTVLKVRPDGSYLALEIHRAGGAEATPERLDFTGQVISQNGDRWTIDPYVVLITGDTRIEGNPQIGDFATVNAERRAGGEIWALRIRKVGGDFTWKGYIEAMPSGSQWVVAGRVIYLDGQTQITGDPAVGQWVEIAGVLLPDSRPLARTVRVIVLTPTASPTATRTPMTAAAPTATTTAIPTATPTLTRSAPASTPTPTATTGG